ncbi:triacylglycerol lipase [Teladorsagia circumcincta]|uniref:Triacylglycerol lipase n=1 Tax=Teladorsagia circumcincta TaxID=45464 RepID=A0A2G9TU76_TELCI|nr:triacylglycerol lipase [Teladorsagia circumcincta]
MGLWTAGMKEDFRALRVKYPEYEVWVTGHSLGGAMASLAASYIIAEEGVPSTSVKMVTFGQPRVGDYQYAKVHDTQTVSWFGFHDILELVGEQALAAPVTPKVRYEIAYSFRVTHWRDMVPHLPPKFFMGYYHHESEVFYHLNMAAGARYTVCHGDESEECSDGLFFALSVEDHLHYFDVDVNDYGLNGCNTTV